VPDGLSGGVKGEMGDDGRVGKRREKEDEKNRGGKVPVKAWH
jgi:hypothetical protein